jgi:hypothetical protein
LAIARNVLEAQVVYMAGARVFGLSDACLTGLAMARWGLSSETKIIAATRVPGRLPKHHPGGERVLP